MGPWHLDASLLGPEQCPHGLLLLFELTMQPPVQGEGGCRWALPLRWVALASWLATLFHQANAAILCSVHLMC